MEEHAKWKRYDRQFKIDAVRMVTEGGRKMAEVARELGLGHNQLARWKKELEEEGKEAFPGSGHQSTAEEELKRVKRELARVEEERDILKKALAVFSRRPG
jgi:transposase